MGSKKYQTILEAYNSIYEVTTAPDPKLADKKPVNPQSAQIAKDLFAKPSTIAPAATPAKPAPTTPAAEKPATPPAAPVSPNSTTPAAPAVPQKTFQQELDDLRKASAQATMAGPSKEAQALMSTRAKNILGPEKLRAGIEGQERVEKMKSEIGMPKVEAPKPQAPTPPVAPSNRQPTPPPPPKPSTGLSKDQLDKYNQATSALKGPFSGVAKGRVKDTYGKMTPDEQKTFKDYLKTRPKEEQDLYKFLGEQQIGVPLKEPTDRAAAKELEKMIPKGDKVYMPKSGLQKAHYEPEGEELIENLYDTVLEYLLSEGCTLEESNYIMTYVVEQGMPPQEIMARGIANMLGFDRPHPTAVFARGLQKMLYPNKPVDVKAPKPPVRVTSKPTVAKPNVYRPGATIRATGPNLDKFPELQRFADQGRKIAEPVIKTAGALSALKNITPAGVAAAVMAPTPVGDATLTAAMKRGDVAPPAPKLPSSEKSKVSAVAKPFINTTIKPAAKPASPENPDLKKYDELRKTNPAAAKELGMKIWSQKYKPILSRSNIA